MKSLNNQTTVYGVVGKGILNNNAFLSKFLSSYQQTSVNIQQILPRHYLSQCKNHHIQMMLGWGRKKSFYRANRFAKLHHLPMLTLEDGFLRSLDSGIHSRHACSMVIDSFGIYFDGKTSSYLERLIVNNQPSIEKIQYAHNLIHRILSEKLSKYNTTAKERTLKNLIINDSKINILLIDQVADDQSIIGAGANAESFQKMLKIAQMAYPQAQIWIKAHPAGKRGYLTELNLPSSIHVIRNAVNPIELLQKMDAVYTVSSQMGFEALMIGKKVHCFGVAWYAGWGLTDDTHTPKKIYERAWQRRGNQRKQTSVENLFIASYLEYSHYVNPATGKACQIEQVIDWLVVNRAWRDKLSQELTLYQISFWKNGFIRQFLATANCQFHYKPKIEPRTLLSYQHFFYPKNYPFLLWGLAKKEKLLRQFTQQAMPNIWCMEDGFIRSNGLGATLVEPLSVVLDRTGIYYDATQPSDLEYLLINKKSLNEQQSQRVVNLKQYLLNQQVSKYNVGKHTQLIVNEANELRKILVVGQVEDDLSVKRCASDIQTNLALLQQVRLANPEAYIIYKPHPDVQVGLRKGWVNPDDVQRYANKMVLDISLPMCLDVIDELHTISSLSGFEALLRGKQVHCYGLPFYAGWGLTQDKANNCIAQQTLTRRKQRLENLPKLTLDQLIYATLIDYPLYRLPKGYGLAQVEEVIDYLYPQHDEVLCQPTKRQLVKQIKIQLKTQANTKFMQIRQRFKQYMDKNHSI